MTTEDYKKDLIKCIVCSDSDYRLNAVSVHLGEHLNGLLCRVCWGIYSHNVTRITRKYTWQEFLRGESGMELRDFIKKIRLDEKRDAIIKGLSTPEMLRGY